MVRVLLVVYVCVFGGGHCCCILPQQRQAAFPNGAIPYSHFGIHTLDTTHTLIYQTDTGDWKGHLGQDTCDGPSHLHGIFQETFNFLCEVEN